MNRLDKNKNKILALLILRQIIEDDEDYMFQEHGKLRKYISEIYNKRENEDIFRLLINNHQVDEEQRFKSYLNFS